MKTLTKNWGGDTIHPITADTNFFFYLNLETVARIGPTWLFIIPNLSYNFRVHQSYWNSNASFDVLFLYVCCDRSSFSNAVGALHLVAWTGLRGLRIQEACMIWVCAHVWVCVVFGSWGCLKWFLQVSSCRWATFHGFLTLCKTLYKILYTCIFFHLTLTIDLHICNMSPFCRWGSLDLEKDMPGSYIY